MEYPELDARLRMLAFLRDRLEEARVSETARHGKLWLAYYPSGGGRPTRLQVYSPRIDIAEELGIGGDEAYGRLRELETDGFLRLSFDSGGPEAGGMVGMSITERGLQAIQKLPDAQETWMQGLEAAIRTLREDDSVPEEERQRKVDVLEEAKHIGRPLVVEVIKGMFRGDIPFM